MMIRALTLREIRTWLTNHRTRKEMGECALSFSEISRMAGISRQTLYTLLRGERGKFGEVAQIRLSRVIQQISADPAYQQTRLLRIDFTRRIPRLRVG